MMIGIISLFRSRKYASPFSISRKGCTVNMTTSDEENLVAATKYLSKFVDSLPTAFPGNNSWETILSAGNEAIVVPTQVNYVGKAANIYESGYQLHGSIYVISNCVNTTWLWERLRTSGGAYGGGIDAYSAGFLQELELDDDSLTKAIIGTIRDLEGYQLPDACERLQQSSSILKRYHGRISREKT